MPVFHFNLKNNDGTKTFINADLDFFTSNSIQIINNGFTGFYVNILNEKSDDVIYDSTAGTLTLPIKIKGLSKTINATEPDSDYEVGKSFFPPSGSSDIYYTVEDDSTPTYSFKHLYSGKEIGTGPIKFKSYTQTKPVTSETWMLNTQPTFGAKSWSYDINFTSNGNSYSKFNYYFLNPLETYLRYDTTNVFDINGASWIDENYRIVTFETAPTGDLLTWLEANGIKRGEDITLPDVVNMTNLEDITYTSSNFKGNPTFSSTLNNARVINVGVKGYELLSKANNTSVETSLADLVSPFGITETNKGTAFISSNWCLDIIFEYRLTDENGNNGGTLINWSAKTTSITDLTNEDILILKYNSITDTLTVCELEEYEASTGEFTLSEEVGYYDVLAIALRDGNSGGNIQ